MIRKIETPTLAKLDYAAYTDNPVRYDPEKFNPKPPGKAIPINEMTFNNKLLSPVNSLKETPLTDEEKNSPMAWDPLQNLFWSELKIDKFKNIGSSIISYKWNDPDIFKPYQLIAACYMHNTGSDKEMWIKVEFSHWVKFLTNVTDDDKNGLPEIYGKINAQDIPVDEKRKAFEWIVNSYQKTVLTKEQIVDWITVLASYWYPTLNTDIVDMSNQTTWPNSDTERKIFRKFKKYAVKNPLAVVRGNPHGKPIYNVYIVPGMTTQEDKSDVTDASISGEKILDTGISDNFKNNTKRFEQELASNNNSYESWFKGYTKLIDSQKKLLQSIPEAQMGIEGIDDWVFFKKSFEYLIAGDIGKQKESKNPIPHLKELKKFLDDQKINMLFLIVPNKAEIYFEKTGALANGDIPMIINPYGRKFLSDLQKEGIEVIDLLPAFLEEKNKDSQFSEFLYQKQDTHWSNRGLQIAATLISDRIKQYSWYKDFSENLKQFSIVDTNFERKGDIIERLPESVKGKYKPAIIKAQRVKSPEGKWYTGNRNDPILLMGDSFTGVFEHVDCKNAGIGAHVAAQTGLGVDIITSWGGGPLVRNKMIRARSKDFGKKRVLVYMMVARDLYDYSQGWEKLKQVVQK
jgi:alginate O-acetyltransferase complex protein AlgJ